MRTQIIKCKDERSDAIVVKFQILAVSRLVVGMNWIFWLFAKWLWAWTRIHFCADYHDEWRFVPYFGCNGLTDCEDPCRLSYRSSAPTNNRYINERMSRLAIAGRNESSTNENFEYFERQGETYQQIYIKQSFLIGAYERLTLLSLFWLLGWRFTFNFIVVMCAYYEAISLMRWRQNNIIFSVNIIIIFLALDFRDSSFNYLSLLFSLFCFRGLV